LLEVTRTESEELIDRLGAFGSPRRLSLGRIHEPPRPEEGPDEHTCEPQARSGAAVQSGQDVRSCVDQQRKADDQRDGRQHDTNDLDGKIRSNAQPGEPEDQFETG
jgi:hypothetical protein